jgi:hypothetical protein
MKSYRFAMLRRFTLNRMDMFGLLAVGVTTIIFFEAALHAANLYARVRPMSAGDIVLGLSGWLIATLGPVIVTSVFWRSAKMVGKAWLIHVLVLPLSLAMLKLGGFLMLSVTGSPDFDDTIGGPVVQAIALLLLALTGYYSAVLYTALKRRRAKADVR